ncbi:MAG: outer membrane beta-barrel domain-containing protein [Myxococcota bacterium]
MTTAVIRRRSFGPNRRKRQTEVRRDRVEAGGLDLSSILSRQSLLYTSVLAVFLGTFAVASPAWADNSGYAYSSRAVQNRHFQGSHEFTSWLGVLPIDAFTKGVTVGGAYTVHFTDWIGWEVVNFLHSFQFDTDLESELDPFDLEPTPFEVLEDLITTNLLFKPIYWKGALLDRAILHGEIGLLLGGGMGWFTRSRRAVVDYGIMFRFYLTRVLSVRIDARHNLFFLNEDNSTDVEHELWTALGLSLQF